MLTGTVLLAHRDQDLCSGMERMLCHDHPALHIERATMGREAICMQSLLRAEAIFMDMNQPDMTGAHLLCELRRDVANPFILVSSSEPGVQAERRALRLGANAYMPAPVNVPKLCGELIGELEKRMPGRNEANVYLAETMLQRVFMERGIPCELKGYAFLKCAVGLILSEEASAECMQGLYEKVGERFCCAASSVEKNMRYAIALGQERAPGDQKRLSNRQFIARILEECQSPYQTVLKPRVSVFCSGRRVFR